MSSYLKPLSILILPLSPITALLISLIRVSFLKKNSSSGLEIFHLSFVLGIINARKLVESDLVLYSKQFEFAGEYGFLEYIILNFKDPFYYALNYFIYHFITDNFTIFLLLFTIISYCFLLKAADMFCRAFGLSHSQCLAALLVLALFPQIFSFSAHLLRQFLAVSIGFYAVAKYFFNSQKKLAILLLVVSVLTHSSNLIFVIFFMADLKVKNLIKWAILLVPIILAVFVFSISDSVLLNGFFRAKNLDAGAELEAISPVVLLFLAVFMVINVIINRYTPYSNNKALFDRMFWSIIGLFLFFVFLGNTEVSNRLLPIIYFFCPLILVYLFFLIEMKFISQSLVIGLFLILFALNLQFGTWTYQDLGATLFFPLLF